MSRERWEAIAEATDQCEVGPWHVRVLKTISGILLP
jgi:hypothetical protein